MPSTSESNEGKSPAAVSPPERVRRPFTPFSAPNVFTVDVEEYFQVSAFEGCFPRDRWDAVPSRLEKGLRAVLEIAGEVGVRGTFFVLGWIARRHPGLVRQIAEAGHEVGCHGLEHRLVYRMDPASFRQDLRAALRAVEDSSGTACRAYRAPSFSVTRKSLWALRVLAEEGIVADSSIYPVVHDRYGIPGAPRSAFRPLREHPGFVEFPPSTVRVWGWTIPCAGGGYLRLFPLAVTLAAIRRIRRIDGHPVVLYVHPWELDPEQPVVAAPWLVRTRHRIGLGTAGARISAILRRFPFASLSDSVEAMGGPSSMPFMDPGCAR